MEVPSFLYNPTESVRATLTGAGMPQEKIEAFIATPDAVMLDEYTETVEVGVSAPDGAVVPMQKALVKGSEKQPIELVNALADKPSVPVSAILLILCGLCTSVMWGGIFNLAVEGLGKYTPQASGIFMMMVVGGGVLPLLQQLIANGSGYMASYWLLVAALGYIFLYAVWGCINVNKDIPVSIEDVEEEELV